MSELVRQLTDGSPQTWQQAAGKGVLASYLWNNSIKPGLNAVYGDPIGTAKAIGGGIAERLSPEHRESVVASALQGDYLPAFMDAMDIGGIGSPIGAVAAPRGAVGMFAGKMSKTADLKALDAARALEQAGKHPDDIWKETGWGRGADNEWRYEIDDSKSSADLRAAIDEDGFGVGDRLPIGGVLNHREAYAAYPGLDDLEVRFLNKGDPFGYAPNPTFIGAPVDASDQRAGSYLLHELQHHVQGLEGFANGGTLKNGADEYKRLAGEVEARNVQKRQAMTADERRANPPWYTEDIPRDQQLIRSGNGPASLAEWLKSGGI